MFQKVLNAGVKYALPVAKTLFGMGDYHVQNDTQKNSLFVDGAYNFKRQKTILTHREYITDIITSNTAGSFQYITYSINPGATNLFPWLSTIA